MKKKIINLLIFSVMFVCTACSKTQSNVTSVTSSVVEPVEQFTEVVSEAVSLEDVSSEEPRVIQVKTLQDIVLDDDYLVESKSDFEISVEESVEVSTEITDEQADEVLDEVWDKAIFESIGVHMPYLDDWYSYIKSDITREGNIFKFTETGTKDMSKLFIVEASEDPLYPITGGKSSGDYIEIKGVQYKYYIDSDFNLELICYVDNIYMRFTSENIEITEYLELVEHIVTLL